MGTRKICVVVTARPSYSRVKSALQAIHKHEQLELQLVVAGSALLDRYGNAVEIIERDGFTITEKVFMVLEGENKTAMAKSTGLAVMELSNLFYNLQPDAVITIADRYETIATSIAAAYQNIPLIHLQGGEVTGSIDEKVRHANTKLADIHLVASEKARERVIRLGEHANVVFNVGCPSIDLALQTRKSKKLSFNPIDKYGGVGAYFDHKQPYLVVMQHPVTTEYELSRQHITETLKAIDELAMPTYWFWPNVDAGSDGTSKGIRAYREQNEVSHIRFFKNMEPDDFLELLIHSSALVGNSSVGIRECSFLGVPVVNIGTRQKNRERGGNVIDVDYNRQSIITGIKRQLSNDSIEPCTTYGDGRSGERIAELLATIDLPYQKTIAY